MNNELIKSLKKKISFLDIGALGYSYEPLEKYAKLFWYHGFDPVFSSDNKNNKLLTNAKKKWGDYTVHPYALNDKKTKNTKFNIYNSDTNNSFLKSNQTLVNRYSMHAKWSIIKELIIKTEKIDSISLKTRDKNFGDVIKIDTQGTELKILKGAKNVLRNTKFIISEVSFVHLYNNQNLFSELEIYLRKFGFSFYCFTDIFFRSKKLLNKLKYLGRERMIYSDAIFIKDPFDENPNLKLTERDIIVILICSISFKLFDFSLELLQKINISKKSKNILEKLIIRESKKTFNSRKINNLNVLDLEKKIKDTRFFTNLNEYI